MAIIYYFVFPCISHVIYQNFCNMKTLRNHALQIIFFSDSCTTLNLVLRFWFYIKRISSCWFQFFAKNECSRNLSSKTKLLCPSSYLGFVLNFSRLLCCCANSYLLSDPSVHFFSVILAVVACERCLSDLCDCLQQLACLHWYACLVAGDDLVWQLKENSTRKLNTSQDISSCEKSWTYNLPSY